MPNDALAPRIVVRDVRTGVRAVKLRLPFRFGAVTLTQCPQLFVRATVEVAGRGNFEGDAAEMLVPKWFDKRPDRSHTDNVDDLVRSLDRAIAAYRNDAPATPFGLHARHDAALTADDHGDGATGLSRAYGAAVLDRAVLDATCRGLGVSFFEAAHGNAFGFADDALIADLAGFDWSGFLAGLRPLRRIAVRHTVGLLDRLDAEEIGADGLPVSLPSVIARHGVKHFKLKVGGDPVADGARVAAVLDVLETRAPGFVFTLDGNEQYRDAEALRELFARVAALPTLRRRPDALLYVEQPTPRESSLDRAVDTAGAPAPLLLDEADATFGSFVAGARLGWRGVSSKACKGLYKAIANRARCAQWNAALARDGLAPAYFMSAEDLTCQAGLSVQQDLALVSLLGLAHGERNGHHYGGGLQGAPAAERAAFSAAHSDLYEGPGDDGSDVRLAICDGRLAIDSLFAPGYATSAHVDFDATASTARASSMV